MNLSIILPTYQRESVLVETLGRVLDQLGPGDEVLVIDQSPTHEPLTTDALTRWVQAGKIRWYRKRRAGQVEAMNVGARLARHDGLVFLDDDVIPCPDFLAAYRQAFADVPEAPAFCGQVMQPWHSQPLDHVDDFGLGFDAAFGRSCEAACLMEGNFAMRRQTYLDVGGMDENFSGCTYRHGTELAYRLAKRTGRRPRFWPAASVRHLYAGGGQRAHGAKDSWGHLGASTGDYYFAWRCLPMGPRALHCLRRWLRATCNRNTLTHPWLMPMIATREVVAWGQATWRAWRGPGRFIRALTAYADCSPWRGTPAEPTWRAEPARCVGAGQPFVENVP